MKKINFKDTEIFSQLEDKAIDGQLSYEDFPPREYKYFSKLTKLGYLNRHKGWSAEICRLKQNEYKKEYLSETDERDMFLKLSIRIQNNITSTADMVRQMYKSSDREEIISLALMTIENLTDENGFAQRISERLENL